MNRRTIRVSDDNGRTRRVWQALGGPNLNAEDWDGLSLTTITGRPVGRPRKLYDQLGRTGRIERAKAVRALLSDPEVEVEPECSGPSDWARERREREEALERVRNRSRGEGSSG